MAGKEDSGLEVAPKAIKNKIDVADVVADQGLKLAGLAETVATLDAAVEGLNGKSDNIMNMLTELMNGMSALNRGSGPSARGVDIRDLEDPQFPFGSAVTFDEANNIERPTHTDVHSAAFKSHKDEIAFQKDMIKIRIMESNGIYEDDIFFVGVNGDQRMFVRGGEYVVPRYIVGQLTTLKPHNFKNEEYTRSDGTRDYRQPVSRSIRYPFQVLHDPAGSRGAEWLRNQNALA